jgi:hypothetical protein
MNQRFAGGHEPSHQLRCKAVHVSPAPLLDRCEGKLHHTLELDIDVLRLGSAAISLNLLPLSEA